MTAISSRTWTLATLLGLVVALCSGCAASRVRSAFAGDFRCAEAEVTVQEIASDRYRASGCSEAAVYQCTSTNTGAVCVTDHVEEQTSLRAPLLPRARTEVSGSVRTGKEKGRATVTLNMRLDEFALLKMHARPEKKVPDVYLTVVRREEDDEGKDCRPAWLINGERRLAPEPKISHTESVIWTTLKLPPDIVEELGSARKFSIKICQRRWRFNDEQLEKIHEFVAQLQEERAWSGPPDKDARGSLPPPRGGWVDWAPATDRSPRELKAAALDATALFKRLSPSIFQVVAEVAGGVSQGSAVAVSSSELLTNCHVVSRARKIRVKQGKNEWPATLLRSHTATDRCVLSVSAATLSAVEGIREFDTLTVGEPLYTIGSPNGLELSLANGILSGRREEEGRCYVQTTAPISPGSSGGGLFDAHGNLVGITTMVLLGREHINQSLNFAIPADFYWDSAETCASH